MTQIPIALERWPELDTTRDELLFRVRHNLACSIAPTRPMWGVPSVLQRNTWGHPVSVPNEWGKWPKDLPPVFVAGTEVPDKIYLDKLAGTELAVSDAVAYEQSDDMTHEQAALEWVAAEWPKLRAMARAIANCDANLADELLGEMIDRAGQLFRSWKIELGELDVYMRASLRRYLIKWKQRERLRKRRERSAPEYAERGVVITAVDRPAIMQALAALSDDEFCIVAQVFWCGQSIRKAADALGWSFGTAQRRYQSAIEQMRNALGVGVEPSLE